MDSRVLNILMLGAAFMFVFTAFQTMGNIEQTIIDSMAKDYPSFKNASGYTSLAIIYIVFALCNWIAPSIIGLTSPKIAMIVGGAIYTLFILSFLLAQVWLLYLMSVIIGFGAAIIWTGQGSYMILNSDKTTIQRNSAIFWAMLQCSQFIGNLFVFFEFQGEETIGNETRTIVFIVLGVIAGVGVVVFLFLRPSQSETGEINEEKFGAWQAFMDSVKLFTTKEMLLVSVAFFYTGMELSFFSGVYGTSLKNTTKFGSIRTQLIGLSGIFVGVGEVLGGLLFSILGSRTMRWGRDPIIIAGFLLHIVSYFLIFINIPYESPIVEDSIKTSYIDPNPYVAMLCSFLLGFGDACYNTQIYSLMGSVWANNSAPAVALFKFTQSLAAAICFFYSTKADLRIQLGLLIPFATFGTVAFCLVEWADKKRRKKASVETLETSSKTSIEA